MSYLHIVQPSLIILQVLLIQTRMNIVLLHNSVISKHKEMGRELQFQA